MRIRLFFQFALVANFSLSLYLFLQQGGHSGISIPHIDKVGHFIAFFVLALCTDFATKLKPFIAVTLLSIYGVSIEIMQSYIPGRDATLGDFIADISGVLAYYCVVARTALVKRFRAISLG